MVEENPAHFAFLSAVVVWMLTFVHHTLALWVVVYRLPVREVYRFYQGS
jgi:ABC-type uncharacterized transport system permease subunit